MTQLLTPETTRKLIDKLATDDGFREQLLGDPVAAMASLGVSVDPSHVAAKRTLPAKATIAANRDAICQRLQGTAGMGVFFI